MLAHVRNGPDPQLVGKDSVGACKSNVGTPSHHPPAKQGHSYGCGDGVNWTHPVSAHRNVPVNKQELCPVYAKELEKEIPREQTVKHRPAKWQLNKPCLQTSNQWSEVPRSHTAQTLWPSCNYIEVWSSIQRVGVVFGGPTSYSLRRFGPHLARHGSPPPHTISICPSLKVRPKDSTVITLP